MQTSSDTSTCRAASRADEEAAGSSRHQLDIEVTMSEAAVQDGLGWLDKNHLKELVGSRVKEKRQVLVRREALQRPAKDCATCGTSEMSGSWRANATVACGKRRREEACKS